MAAPPQPPASGSLWLLAIPVVPALVSLWIGLVTVPRARELFEDFQVHLSPLVRVTVYEQPLLLGTVAGLLAIAMLLTLMRARARFRLAVNLTAGLLMLLIMAFEIAGVMATHKAMVTIIAPSPLSGGSFNTVNSRHSDGRSAARAIVLA